jgi:hypothetical protein
MVSAYHADNGTFKACPRQNTALPRVKNIPLQDQNIHHQHGKWQSHQKDQRTTREVLDMACTMLIHVSKREGLKQKS